jgi:thymidylate synthase ThyX
VAAAVRRWYSFQITTSRRVAQELTRHGFQSAVSGESTRFVDVQDNELIFHPDFTMDEQDLQTMHKAVKDRSY